MTIRRRCSPGGGEIGGYAVDRLIVIIISANYIQVVSDGVFHTGPEYMELLVAGVENRVVDLVLLIAAQPAQAKSPEISLKPVPAA